MESTGATDSAPGPIFSLGHGTLPSDRFAAILTDAAIERLIDVRSYPGSRRNPQYSSAAMQDWVPAVGVEYRWVPDLGGRRRPVPDSKHVALRNESFRAYADHMATAAFSNAVEDLVASAADTTTVVVCSESVWWRCHRRLLADYVVGVCSVPVVHLMHDLRRTPHPMTDGSRVVDGRIIYDVVDAERTG